MKIIKRATQIDRPTRCYPFAMAVVFAAIAVLFVGQANADIIGIWQFDGDYTNSMAGGSSIDAANDLGNNPGSFIGTSIGGGSATVLDYSAAPSGSFFDVANDAAPNGGGTGTNNYTFGFDVMIDDVAAGFTSLLQTNTFGGDVDLYVRPNGALDMSFGATDSATGLVVDGAWNRIIVSREAGSATGFKVYLNGTQVLTHNAFGVDDGDYRIDGTWRPLSDNSGETNDLQINSMAYWDETLTDVEIAALGGATAIGFSAVPEPAGLALVTLAGMALVTLRRRK